MHPFLIEKKTPLSSSVTIKNDKDFSSSKLNDSQLWAQFKAGDESSFIYIYQLYFDQLVNYCFQFTRDQDLIKDIIQDLFIYLRTNRHTIANTNNIKYYLLKCCRNSMVTALKKSFKTRSLDSLNVDFFQTTDSYEEKIISLHCQEINEKKLKLAISQLSPREREIIYYFYYEGLGYPEIAGIMEYKETKSVRSLLYKSLSKLKDYMEIVLR